MHVWCMNLYWVCCGDSSKINDVLVFDRSYLLFSWQMVDPTLAEMGKNLNEAMKMLEDNQRYVQRITTIKQYLFVLRVWLLMPLSLSGIELIFLVVEGHPVLLKLIPKQTAVSQIIGFLKYPRMFLCMFCNIQSKSSKSIFCRVVRSFPIAVQVTFNMSVYETLL